MTMIDLVTNWFEIGRILTHSSTEAQRVFDSLWLAQYPRPKEIGFDNGGEFKAIFRGLTEKHGIKKKAHNRL